MDYSNSFVHLHLHTQYSLLDGAIRVKDLCQRVKELGMPAVAQTDHGNMFGAIDFYQTAKKAGIKPILGSEIYFTPGHRFDRKSANKTKVLASQDAQESKHHIHHLVLLAKNQTGLENLYKLLSKAYLEGFYYKPRADIELLKEFSEGLIATTACLKGEVGYNFFIGQEDKSYAAIMKLREIYKDDFYLEIQENGIPEQNIVNAKILEFGGANSIPIVATNDCHYLNREDAAAQEVLLCVQTGKTFADEQRMKLTTSEFYLKSPEEMRKNFSYYPQACDNTLRIAKKVNLELRWVDDQGRQIYHLPEFKIETAQTTEEYMAVAASKGLEERFAGPHFSKLITRPDWETTQKPIYLKRLHDEIEMINQMGFTGYFLIVSDFIIWAKKQNIPVGPGRGSGAGSLVAYCLSITNIDPIRYNLLFERFINPERISMPDFDIDFCQDRRNEVIKYVTEKYGSERVGQIITFGKLQAKAVLRDVGRVYGLPYSEIDMLSKLVPEELGITLDRALELEPKLREWEQTDPKIKQILRISRRLEGLLRHASIHAAGVIITNKPLVHYCPLYKGKEGEQVVQFDKDFCETIGLIKFDFLGLKTLTVIETATQFIRRDHDPLFDIENIDLDDPKVYELLSSGDTIGVFQLESAGMRDLCKRIRPDNLEDITAINALYRPGPLGSGMVDDFVEIKHGRKPTHYPFDALIPVLKDTYGIIVYQEQVQNIARIIGGYSLGQADILRRAMGKKKADVMTAHREIFCKGAKERNFDDKKAGELFDLMAMFAEYGFNKSHAVAYALIAFQTAYLKCYYPSCFYAAILSMELGNTDKVTTYIKDAKEHGIEILPPDVNESLWRFNVVGSKIRFGLGAIKNVGEGGVQGIIHERTTKGPFESIFDVCSRISSKLMNKRILESMIRVGVFDSIEKYNRKTLFENVEMIQSHCAVIQEERAIGQVSLFSFIDGPKKDSELKLDIVDEYTDQDKLRSEFELMGVYVSGHPLDKAAELMRQLSSMDIASVHDLLGDQVKQLTLTGMIMEKKEFMTKKGERMAFATLEDLSGKIECVIFPKIFAECAPYLGTDMPLLVEGEVKLSESPRKFFPRKIAPLKEKAQDKVRSIIININREKLAQNQDKIYQLRDVIQSYKGTVPISLVMSDDFVKAKIGLGEEFLVNPVPELTSKINALFEMNCVQFNCN